MAHFKVSYAADCVKDVMDLHIVIPQKKHVRCAASPGMELGSFRSEYPVLLLLHDEASSPLELCAMTGLERFADARGLMVVVPQGLLSWYTDYAQRDCSSNSSGNLNDAIEANFTEMCYETFLMEALRYVRLAFPAAADREKTFVGGVGMGGFGAFKLAAKHPDAFAAAFSISGALDLQWRMDHDAGRREQFEAVFGGLKAEGENDLPARCAELARRADGPRLLQLWAGEDPRLEENRRAAQALAGAPRCRAEQVDSPYGWDYIDAALREAVAWL